MAKQQKKTLLIKYFTLYLGKKLLKKCVFWRIVKYLCTFALLFEKSTIASLFVTSSNYKRIEVAIIV